MIRLKELSQRQIEYEGIIDVYRTPDELGDEADQEREMEEDEDDEELDYESYLAGDFGKDRHRTEQNIIRSEGSRFKRIVKAPKHGEPGAGLDYSSHRPGLGGSKILTDIEALHVEDLREKSQRASKIGWTELQLWFKSTFVRERSRVCESEYVDKVSALKKDPPLHMSAKISRMYTNRDVWLSNDPNYFTNYVAYSFDISKTMTRFDIDYQDILDGKYARKVVVARTASNQKEESERRAKVTRERARVKSDNQKKIVDAIPTKLGRKLFAMKPQLNGPNGTSKGKDYVELDEEWTPLLLARLTDTLAESIDDFSCATCANICGTIEYSRANSSAYRDLHNYFRARRDLTLAVGELRLRLHFPKIMMWRGPAVTPATVHGDDFLYYSHSLQIQYENLFKMESQLNGANGTAKGKDFVEKIASCGETGCIRKHWRQSAEFKRPPKPASTGAAKRHNEKKNSMTVPINELEPCDSPDPATCTHPHFHPSKTQRKGVNHTREAMDNDMEREAGEKDGNEEANQSKQAQSAPEDAFNSTTTPEEEESEDVKEPNYKSNLPSKDEAEVSPQSINVPGNYKGNLPPKGEAQPANNYDELDRLIHLKRFMSSAIYKAFVVERDVTFTLLRRRCAKLSSKRKSDGTTSQDKVKQRVNAPFPQTTVPPGLKSTVPIVPMIPSNSTSTDTNSTPKSTTTQQAPSPAPTPPAPSIVLPLVTTPDVPDPPGGGGGGPPNNGDGPGGGGDDNEDPSTPSEFSSVSTEHEFSDSESDGDEEDDDTHQKPVGPQKDDDFAELGYDTLMDTIVWTRETGKKLRLPKEYLSQMIIDLGKGVLRWMFYYTDTMLETEKFKDSIVNKRMHGSQVTETIPWGVWRLFLSKSAYKDGVFEDMDRGMYDYSINCKIFVNLADHLLKQHSNMTSIKIEDSKREYVVSVTAKLLDSVKKHNVEYMCLKNYFTTIMTIGFVINTLNLKMSWMTSFESNKISVNAAKTYSRHHQVPFDGLNFR